MLLFICHISSQRDIPVAGSFKTVFSPFALYTFLIVKIKSYNDVNDFNALQIILK